MRLLLAGAIDYAGLFPPARLDVPAAADEYARYRGSDDAWALGRFVAPWSSLAGLARSVQAREAPWPVSAVMSPDDRPSIDELRQERTRHATALSVESLEVRVPSTALNDTVSNGVAAGFEVFAEVPFGHGVDRIVQAVGDAGACAKIRTGGVTTDAFPEPADVVRFLRACHRHRVRFKATAGLHHPLRGEYRLTYDRDSAMGPMFGFVNIMLAAALVLDGQSDDLVLAALTEASPDALEPVHESLRWRGRMLDGDLLRRVRAESMTGFGSCSFREPLDELPAPLVSADRS